MVSVKEKTLKYNLCIGCGICKAGCHFGAIEMKYTDYGEFRPVIDRNKCTNCGMCEKICANTKEKFLEEAKNLNKEFMPKAFGLPSNTNYLMYTQDDKKRLKCASGGTVTTFAEFLLDTGKIDGVIHGERVFAKPAEPHFRAVLSKTKEEIKNRAGSIYAPLEFSGIIDELEEEKTYLLCAAPCTIKSFKNLFKTNKKFKRINLITCALVCSHNVSGQYSEYLAKVNGVEMNNGYFADFRNKDKIPNANDFNTHFYDEEKTLFKLNRHSSHFTQSWRGYYFGLNACSYCPDFWGYAADFSVKDAWGKWSEEDPLGKSIVLVRNSEIDKLLENCGLSIEPLDFKTMRKHQEISSIYKQQEAYNKNFKSIFSLENRRNGLLRNVVVSNITKISYKFFGAKFTKFLGNLLCRIL